MRATNFEKISSKIADDQLFSLILVTLPLITTIVVSGSSVVTGGCSFVVGTISRCLLVRIGLHYVLFRNLILSDDAALNSAIIII